MLCVTSWTDCSIWLAMFPGLWFVMLVIPETGSQVHSVGLRDYCQSEYFNASCGSNQVLLMQTAHYGRMSAGRCVSANHGYMGCSKNVIGYMHKKCSGKQRCLVYVAEPELHDTRPCHRDFTAYLQASYDCIDVASSDNHICSLNTHAPLKGPVGYISSATLAGRAGTPSCPWRITVPHGQTIRLTLFNFAISTREEMGGLNYQPGKPDLCYQVGTVRERNEEKHLTSCGDSGRETVAYTSQTNTIEVQMREREIIDMMGPFLIKYEAMGCEKLKLPDTVWAKIEGDYITVRCNVTQESWSLTCKDNTWIGEVGECEATGANWNIQEMFTGEETNFPYGILVLVAIGVALGVFLGGLLLSLAIFYIKRNHVVSRSRSQVPAYTDVPTDHPKFLESQSHVMAEPCTWPRPSQGHLVTEIPVGVLTPLSCETEIDGQSIKEGTLCSHGHGTYQSRPCRLKMTPHGTRMSHVYESPQFS